MIDERHRLSSLMTEETFRWRPSAKCHIQENNDGGSGSYADFWSRFYVINYAVNILQYTMPFWLQFLGSDGLPVDDTLRISRCFNLHGFESFPVKAAPITVKFTLRRLR
ncbi:hypothetical protein NPIL_19951 [Nephila pilipes]|uniref:Uncharacterized protein n=1 Tax=Nephila pilipes TaxID=299642 RepID=A0A8X6U4H5_NEPPI|nr:hypothetical protein NPIL_19951 [Nephila pilipes]